MRTIGHFKTRVDAEKMRSWEERLEKRRRNYGYYNIWHKYNIVKLANGKYSLQSRRFRRPVGTKTKRYYPTGNEVPSSPPKFSYRIKPRRGKR